jgi:hypothetical protein
MSACDAQVGRLGMLDLPCKVNPELVWDADCYPSTMLPMNSLHGHDRVTLGV